MYRLQAGCVERKVGFIECVDVCLWVNSRKWTESTGSFLSMNEMQKGGEIPERRC